MSALPIMADSTRPQSIPDKFRMGNNGAAAYIDGSYAWSESEQDEFPRLIRISTNGDARMAEFARCIDVERFDATPADVPGFIEVRNQHSHPNTLVYCDLSTVQPVLVAAPREDYHFWIATLDNFYRGPQEVAALLRSRFGVDINPDRIAANQWLNALHYDQSTWFISPDWDTKQ